MKKSTKQALFILVIVAILLTLLLVFSLLSDRVSMNPLGTVGNTAGNLNNGGLFCEYNETIFFSNARENGKLYAMNPDESNVRKLSDLHVCNILAGGKYLYYFQHDTGGGSGFSNIVSVESFNRCNLKGTNTRSLTRDIVVKGQLVNNHLYLLTSDNNKTYFYKMKIDKSEIVPLADYEVNPSCARDGIIYFNGTQNDHYLYTLDTKSDISTEIWQGNLWYPLIDGDYIYYMDLDLNYSLCRYSLSTQTSEVLTEDRVECFNVGNGYIYYQKNGDNPQLRCMRTDGTNNKVIAEGNYTNINMTSQYVYFQEFGFENLSYHSYIGSDSYSDFNVH